MERGQLKIRYISANELSNSIRLALKVEKSLRAIGLGSVCRLATWLLTVHVTRAIKVCAMVNYFLSIFWATTC